MEGSTSIENENREVLFPAANRFSPTDVELIVHYLLRKLNEPGFSPNIIKEVDLYKFHPEELIGKYGTEGEMCSYFFTPTPRKYRNGCRPRRCTTGGFWKAKTADIKIKDSNSNKIGLKKSFRFHNGFPKAGQSEKTSWRMQEFRTTKRRNKEQDEKVPMKLDNWVLCRIYKVKTKRVANVREVPEVKKRQDGEGEAKEVANVREVPEVKKRQDGEGEAKEEEGEDGTGKVGQDGEGDAKEAQGKDNTDIIDISKCMDADCIEDIYPKLLNWNVPWNIFCEVSDTEEAMRLFLDAGI